MFSSFVESWKCINTEPSLILLVISLLVEREPGLWAGGQKRCLIQVSYPFFSGVYIQGTEFNPTHGNTWYGPPGTLEWQFIHVGTDGHTTTVLCHIFLLWAVVPALKTKHTDVNVHCILHNTIPILTYVMLQQKYSGRHSITHTHKMSTMKQWQI